MGQIKKIVIVFSVCILFIFSTFTIPEKKVHAVAWGAAIPAGVTAGGGAYTLGAMGLAGLLGAIGYTDNADAINAHARAVWDGSTQISLDSINWSIDQAKNIGHGLTQFDSAFNDWTDGFVNDFSVYIADLINPLGNPTIDESVASTGFPDVTFDMVLKSTGTVSRSGKFSASVAYSSNLAIYYVKMRIGSTGVGDIYTVNGTRNEAVSIVRSLTPSSAARHMAEKQSNFDFTFTVDNQTWTNTYNNSVSKVREAWESVADAGLVLPVNDAVPLSGGQALKYNPATDTYTFPSGEMFDGNVNDLEWSFPQPRIVPDIMTGQDRVVVPTTNPAIDGTFPNVKTGTWTDVFTGEIVTSNVAVPDVPVVEPTPNPPLDLSRPTKALSFAPLMLVGDNLKEKFPFSIPFDFLKQLGIFNVEPEAPKITVNMPADLPGGVRLPASFDLDFSRFDKVATMARWFSVIIFDVGLILAIRRFMPE